jgi:hypothetical protein
MKRVRSYSCHCQSCDHVWIPTGDPVPPKMALSLPALVYLRCIRCNDWRLVIVELVQLVGNDNPADR